MMSTETNSRSATSRVSGPISGASTPQSASMFSRIRTVSANIAESAGVRSISSAIATLSDTVAIVFFSFARRLVFKFQFTFCARPSSAHGQNLVLHLPDPHAVGPAVTIHRDLTVPWFVLIDHPVPRLAPEALPVSLGSRLLRTPEMQDRGAGVAVGLAVQERQLLRQECLPQQVRRPHVLHAGKIDADARAGLRHCGDDRALAVADRNVGKQPGIGEHRAGDDGLAERSRQYFDVGRRHLQAMSLQRPLPDGLLGGDASEQPFGTARPG